MAEYRKIVGVRLSFVTEIEGVTAEEGEAEYISGLLAAWVVTRVGEVQKMNCIEQWVEININNSLLYDFC